MLSSTANSAVYHADGGTAVFPIPFPFQRDGHIHAHLRGTGGTRSLEAGKDYAVRRTAGGGGEIVLLGDLPPGGTELVVRRLLPLTQEILFHNQGPNSPSATEEAIDKLTMIAQQLAGRLDGAMPIPPADGKAYLAGSGGWVEYAPPPPAPSPPAPPPPAAGENGGTDAPALAGIAGRVTAVEATAEELAATTTGLEATTTQLEASTAELAARAAQFSTGLADADERIASALAGVAGVRESLAGLGALAQGEDAPADGEAYLRCGGAWVRHANDAGGGTGGGGSSGTSASGGGGAYPGEIRLMPFRPGELPVGWHACDGSSYSRGTPVFNALSELPANFISDWRMARSSFSAALPNLRGCVFRSTGGSELPGAAVTGGGGAGGTAYAMTAAIYLGDS